MSSGWIQGSHNELWLDTGGHNELWLDTRWSQCALVGYRVVTISSGWTLGSQ